MNFIAGVVDFNRNILGIEPRPLAPLNAAEHDITMKCLKEELDELQEATDACDIIGQVDAHVDAMYFHIGAMYKMGLTAEQIERCCMAVHNANMTKKRGINARRGDGSAADAVKPDGWVAPEELIGEILG